MSAIGRPGRPRKKKPCTCARCRGLATADQRYGYDKAAVPAVPCLFCDQPIGDQAYVEITHLARFGSMMFAHATCSAEAKR